MGTLGICTEIADRLQKMDSMCFLYTPTSNIENMSKESKSFNIQYLVAGSVLKHLPSLRMM
jgi:hypothetical protein